MVHWVTIIVWLGTISFLLLMIRVPFPLWSLNFTLYLLSGMTSNSRTFALIVNLPCLFVALLISMKSGWISDSSSSFLIGYLGASRGLLRSRLFYWRTSRGFLFFRSWFCFYCTLSFYIFLGYLYDYWDSWGFLIGGSILGGWFFFRFDVIDGGYGFIFLSIGDGVIGNILPEYLAAS